MILQHKDPSVLLLCVFGASVISSMIYESNIKSEKVFTFSKLVDPKPKNQSLLCNTSVNVFD